MYTSWGRVGSVVLLLGIGGCHSDKDECRALASQVSTGLEALLAVETVVGADEATFAAARQQAEKVFAHLAAVPVKDQDSQRVRVADSHRQDLLTHGRVVMEALEARRRLRAADPNTSLKLIGPAADSRARIDRMLRVPTRCD